MDEGKIDAAIDEIAAHYPDELSDHLKANHGRIKWQIQEITKHARADATLLDLGAGIVPFMPVCKMLGYDAIIADDYGDDYYRDKGLATVLDHFHSIGVRVVEQDIFDKDFVDNFDKLDVVTAHDTMEHWHNSPKELFHGLWSKLSPDGLLWVGVPNCVNLRKRLTTPLGRAKWSSMADWYETPVFRGHVREPDVDDLQYIARDLGAARTDIVGRNWIGYRHPSPLVRKVTPFADKLLRMRPSLCSDIYLYAWK